MNCPHDRHKLVISSTEGHSGLACAHCHGTWLPFPHVESIKYTFNFTPEEFKRQLRDAVQTKSTLPCPSGCGTLNLTTIHDIDLDWCPSCYGVWFDNGELKKLLATFGRTSSDGSATYVATETAGNVLLLIVMALTS